MLGAMKIGVVVYGLAAIAAGAIDLAWGSFERAHQPLQAFGDNIPGAQAFAYIIAAVLVIGGAAILVPRYEALGAVLLGMVYLIFTIFWLPRLYTAPMVLGHSLAVYAGVLGGICQQLIIVGAALIVYSRGLLRTARWIFGLSSIDFGIVHLTGIAANTGYVPHWLPFGQQFWVAFTGIAFVLAGVAIVSGILDVLAARLLALMLLVFSFLALLPILLANLHQQIPWGANAYNLMAAASVWILASSLAAARMEMST